MCVYICLACCADRRQVSGRLSQYIRKAIIYTYTLRTNDGREIAHAILSCSLFYYRVFFSLLLSVLIVCYFVQFVFVCVLEADDAAR